MLCRTILSIGTILIATVSTVGASWEVPEGMFFVGDEEQESRGLQSVPKCPDGTTQYKAFYNVLFEIESHRETSCSDQELNKVGKILQREFDNILEKSDDNGYDDKAALLSSHTDVCTAYDNAKYQRRNGGRNLRILFRVYLFRSVGKCYLCWSDNRDGRALDENPSDALTTSSTTTSADASRQLQDSTEDRVNLYFAEVMEDMQEYLDARLTVKLRNKARRQNIGCLKGDVKPTVKTTVVIKFDEVKEACEAVYCCASSLDPTTGCMDFPFAQFCHTSESTCDNDCGGIWINSAKPPVCTASYGRCDSRRRDQCCPKNTCISNYFPTWGQCVPDSTTDVYQDNTNVAYAGVRVGEDGQAVASSSVAGTCGKDGDFCFGTNRPCCDGQSCHIGRCKRN